VYRIIYDIAGKAPDQTLRIILIGKRNGDEVYEKLKRLN
jgi:FlaA1/EpsC-like NDP-sugar epimerase